MIEVEKETLEPVPGFKTYTRKVVSADGVVGLVKTVVATELTDKHPEAHRLIAIELSKTAYRASQEVVRKVPR